MKVKKENVDLLKEWDGIRQSVKRGLKRLGHDILLVCMEPEDKKGKGSEEDEADCEVR